MKTIRWDMLGLLVSIVAMLAGCDSASRDAFRDAASDHLETAVNDVLQGVADGVFEVLEPNPESQRR